MIPLETISPLETLRSDFAVFRSRYGTRARVPKHLRQAVFAAIDSGLEPREVSKALGLSRNQIAFWRRGKAPVKPAAEIDGPPRILSVNSPGAEASSGFRISYKSKRLSLEFTI